MGKLESPDFVPEYLQSPEIDLDKNGAWKTDYSDGVTVWQENPGEVIETRFANGDLHYEDPNTGKIEFIEGVGE